MAFKNMLARELYRTYPGIHYHITSGNSEFVPEQLDKGLIDFGIVFGPVDKTIYTSISLPYKDTWDVMLRKDSPLAAREAITPENLRDKPSSQRRRHEHYLEKFSQTV